MESPSDIKKLTDRVLQLETTLDYVGAYIFTKDTQGRYTYANKMVCDLFDTPLEQIIGCTVEKFFNHSISNQLRINERRVLDQGEHVESEETIVISGTGETRIYWAVKLPIRSEDGAITGMCGIANDITERRQQELALQMTQVIVDSMDDAILRKTLHGIITSWSIGAERLFGYTAEEAIGHPIAMLVPPDRLEEEKEFLAQLAQGKKIDHFETFRRCKDGRLVETSVSISPILDQDSEVTCTSNTVSVISQYYLSGNVLRASEQRLKTILDNLFSYVALLDVDGKVLEVNKAPLVRSGYRYEDVVGQYFYDAEWWTYDSNVQSQLIAAINAAKQGVISRYDVTVKMGEDLIPVDFQISPIRDMNGNIVGLLPTAVDITDRKLIEAEILKQANFDELTGLPNRRLFNDRLEQAIKKSKRDKSLIALLLIDLDHFKEVNDTSGHGVGDLLLVEAASRLRFCVRDYDTVARLGGDEFTVILSSLDDYSDISRVAQDIIDSISRPYLIQGLEMFVSASIGIALNPDDADNACDLIKSADQAMYQAKKDGRSRYHFFTKSMQDAVDLKGRLTTDLRRALTGGQFEVYYQPIIELGTGCVNKAEALLRWKHPQLGFVSPAAFIPLAEDTGTIHDIGYWVFMQASRQVKKLRGSLGRDFQISVNMSPLQFFTAERDRIHWADQLTSMELIEGSIAIEITEGLLMNNDSGITDSLLKYRDAGIQVAIDDFGTGYSALSYLKKFDIDYLKIDKSFTRNLAPGAPDVALCEAIVIMAHKLGLKVIAEGVETEQQRGLLTQIGCNYAQGYLFSRPLPVADFEQFLTHG